MRRALALAGLLFGAAACDGQFAFDTATPFGSGGAGTGGAAGGASGSAGTGGAVASECATRCRSAGLQCLTSLQLCVECVADVDCTKRDARRCGVSGQTQHRCLGCLSNDDCGDHEQCDVGTHSCVTRCDDWDDRRCDGSGVECNPRLGYCAACVDSDDCDDAGLRCSVGDARCVQCVDDDECALEPGKLCDPISQRCVQCRDSFDCSAGRPICDAVLHVCHSIGPG